MGNKSNPLHIIVTTHTEEVLKDAVHKSENELFLLNLSTAIEPPHAHGIHVHYRKCWAINVTNMSQRGFTGDIDMASEAAINLEFMFLSENASQESNILSMAKWLDEYVNIRSVYNIPNLDGSRKKKLKQLIENKLSGMEFQKLKRANLPERISLKETIGAAMQIAEGKLVNVSADVSTLYEVSQIFI